MTAALVCGAQPEGSTEPSFSPNDDGARFSLPTEEMTPDG